MYPTASQRFHQSATNDLRTSWASTVLTSLKASRLIRCASLLSALRRLASSCLACDLMSSAAFVRWISSFSRISSCACHNRGLDDGWVDAVFRSSLPSVSIETKGGLVQVLACMQRTVALITHRISQAFSHEAVALCMYACVGGLVGWLVGWLVTRVCRPHKTDIDRPIY